MMLVCARFVVPGISPGAGLELVDIMGSIKQKSTVKHWAGT